VLAAVIRAKDELLSPRETWRWHAANEFAPREKIEKRMSFPGGS
jgi:hypothetical protein